MRRSLSSMFSSLGVLALCASIAHTASLTLWTYDPVIDSDPTNDCYCISLPGEVGILDQFAHTTSASACLTQGRMGTWWSGPRGTVCENPAVVEKEKGLSHSYQRSGSGPISNGLLSVDFYTTSQMGGSASPFDPNDPSWWWNATASFRNSNVVVTLWVPGQEAPAPSSGWSSTSNADISGTDPGAAGMPDAGPTSFFGVVSAGNGNWSGTWLVSSIDLIYVYTVVTASGGPVNGDNCQVNEQLDVWITLDTSCTAPGP